MNNKNTDCKTTPEGLAISKSCVTRLVKDVKCLK